MSDRGRLPGRRASCQRQEPRTLAADMAGDGQRWTDARQMADVVAAAYQRDPERQVRRWGDRIATCGQHITVAYDRSGEQWRRQIVRADLCRVRTCPICSWRRAERLAAEVGQRVRELCQPGGLIALMLTLTVENCGVEVLRETIRGMLAGWSRLRKRKLICDRVIHWTRSVEVTRGREHIRGDSHPHIHCLLLAQPDDAALLLSADWSAIWRDVMRLSYQPVTHIMPLDAGGGVSEALKYTVKPHDLARHAISGWLGKVGLALDGIRVFACDEGLRLREPESDDAESTGGELVDALPDGIPTPPKKAPLSVVYHWSGRAYLRGLVSIGYGAAECRALLSLSWQYRRR